jgi:hypothetical protein
VSQDKGSTRWVLYRVSTVEARAHRQSPHFLAYDAVAACRGRKTVAKCAGRHVT